MSSATQANSYIERNNAHFGWSTTDEDNTYGASTILYSGLPYYLPWVGAIRTSDMQLTHAESPGSYLDLDSVAMELAGE